MSNKQTNKLLEARHADFQERDFYCGIADGGEPGLCCTHAADYLGKTVRQVQWMAGHGQGLGLQPEVIWCGARLSAHIIPFGQLLEVS